MTRLPLTLYRFKVVRLVSWSITAEQRHDQDCDIIDAISANGGIVVNADAI